MDGYKVYEMIQDIANTDDGTLKDKFGTYELDDIILNHSLTELWNIWCEVSK